MPVPGCAAGAEGGDALVAAAIALWNTVYLGRAVEALRRREAVPDALLAHLAPLSWQQVNLMGDYLWDTGATLAPDGFRPLRGTRTTLPPPSDVPLPSRSA